jgi:multidrug efflux system membrane fusion protein
LTGTGGIDNISRIVSAGLHGQRERAYMAFAADLTGRAARSVRRLGLRLAAGTVAAATLFGLWGCGGGYSQPGGAAGPQGAVAVTAAKATVETVPVRIETFGTAQEYSTVSVKSQVTGQLVEVHVKEGQEVKKGDLVLSIDARAFEAALKLAQANLARDTAQAQLATIELARTDRLFKSSTASSDDLDKAKAAADAAAAVVNADEAAVENAALQVEFCSIKSPVDGVVGRFLINQGNYIKANDLTIVTINQVTPIYVSLSVPEVQLPAIRRFMAEKALPVSCTIPGQGDGAVEGAVTFVDNTVDRATGTIRLKATFENADKRLWPGQYVRVTLRLADQPNAVVVPSGAIQSGQAGQFLFVVKADMTVEQRPVEVDRVFAGGTVVGKGLAAGETVVTDGQLKLAPGAKVELKESSAAQAGAGR